MAGGFGFEVNLGAARRAASRIPRSSNRRHILVLGDFTGRRSRGIETTADLERRPVVSVDLDSFDAVMERLAPALRLAVPGFDPGDAGLAVRSIDDFHPDRLMAALEPFRRLRESRARLIDPAQFEREAAQLMIGTTPDPATDPATYVRPRLESEGDLLGRLIGTPSAAATQGPARGAIDTLIRRLVQPHIRPGPSRSSEPYLAAIDASLTELMRGLLHDADFQSLEATWRGVRNLVDVLDAESVTLHVADLTKGELLEDLRSTAGDSAATAASRLLARGARQGADAEPWSLLIGHYSFGADGDDLALLGHLGVLASQAGAPLLAAAAPGLAGCSSLAHGADPRQWRIADPEVARRWAALRLSPVAPWLGLALPRILLRLPYGARTDAAESFEFEEFGVDFAHEDYLWGNPALACAQSIAAAWSSGTDAAGLTGSFELEDLPAHVRDVEGERRLQPVAEHALSMHVGEELLRRGFTAVLSYADRNAARVLRLQSIADPPSAIEALEA
jgi:type VI secretion system protein ImpC